MWLHLNQGLACIWSGAQNFSVLVSAPDMGPEGHPFSSPSCLGLLFGWSLVRLDIGDQGNVLSMLPCSFS